MTATITTAPASRTVKPTSKLPIEIGLATEGEKKQIFEARHQVYALEIGQHPPNAQRRLTDSLDSGNVYIVARCGIDVAGFISITPPGLGRYSIDKYFAREDLPFAADAGLFEVRLLTVLKSHRGTKLAVLLMYAAFRWVEAHGGTRIAALGRHEVLPIYLRAGLRQCGRGVRAGEACYHLLHAEVPALRAGLDAGCWPVDTAARAVKWSLRIPLLKPASCFHGGAFFDAVGPRFDHLERVPQVINADVLDAWFPPAPAVTHALAEHLPWLLRTSPPTGCEGLIDTIAAARGVQPANILPGAGSSDLIFRALPRWLNRRSRVLLLDPTYGEYSHMLEKVIGCRVDRVGLRREDRYEVPLGRLETALNQPWDLVVLVNPNSPTGRHIARPTLETLLRNAHPAARVWIDETYADFAGPAQSLERYAADSENVIVCKSMSKAYALSGARAAYLCAGSHQLEELRAHTPPWAVSLVAQLAAVRALESPDYYRARWQETAELRAGLATCLEALGWEIIPGVANFLLGHLPESGPPAAAVVTQCRERGLFLRDASPMGLGMGRHAIRVAVKDADTQARMVAIVRDVVDSHRR